MLPVILLMRQGFILNFLHVYSYILHKGIFKHVFKDTPISYAKSPDIFANIVDTTMVLTDMNKTKDLSNIYITKIWCYAIAIIMVWKINVLAFRLLDRMF